MSDLTFNKIAGGVLAAGLAIFGLREISGMVFEGHQELEKPGYAIAIQSDGKIVVAGRAYNAGDDFAVVRYNTDGSLDTSFDSDGKVTTAVLSATDRALGVAIQSDGKIVAAGYSYNGSNNDFAVVRYNTNGSLDTGFGTSGKVTTPVLSSYDNAFAAAMSACAVHGYDETGERGARARGASARTTVMNKSGALERPRSGGAAAGQEP